MMEDRNTYREMGNQLDITDEPVKSIPLDHEPEPDTRPVILFAAIYTPGYNSDGMVNGFKELGYRVEVVDWQKVRFEQGIDALRQLLIIKAEMDKPEITFLHLQQDFVIDPETAQELSKHSFVVNYTLDVRTNLDWYKSIAPHIGLTLFGDMDSVGELKKEEIFNVDYLASSADFDWYKKLDPKPKNQNWGDIVFIGNNYENVDIDFERKHQRAEMVQFLKDTYGEKFKVYGLGWGGDSRVVNPQEEVLIYNSCKVAITHNQFNRSGYSSDRIWRATGCGCCVVSQYYVGINKDFNQATIGVWLDYSMLKESVDKFLKIPDLARAIGNSAALHVRLNHTWSQRFKQMKQLIINHQLTNNEHSAGGLARV